MASYLSIPPPQSLILQRHRPSPPGAYSTSIKPPRSAYIRSSSSLQTPDPAVAAEEEDSSPPLPLPLPSDDASPPESPVPTPDDLQFRGCKTCGREEIEKGCNGEGRIQGGIATVPGFGWWPIKAFRPCPGFVASGGRYRRRGQSMDEVAFGRGERDSSMGSPDTTKSSERRRGPRRLKG